MRSAQNLPCFAAFLFALFILLAGSLKQLRGQETPPAPEPPRPVQMPKPFETSLANGLRVIILEKSDVPLVTLQLMVKSGGEADPPDRSGTADMTATLLTKGTSTRNAPRIAQAVESLGGVLESGASWDASSVHINVMSDKIAPAMEILGDVVRRPSFQQEEIQRLKRQLLDELKVSIKEPGTLASYVAARVIFGAGTYGHPLPGTPESLAKIQRSDIVALHQKYYRPDNSVLVVAGQGNREEILKSAERVFGDWVRPGAPVPASASPEAQAKSQFRAVAVDMPKAGQAAVVAARTAIRRTDPDFYRGLVTNSVLGGGYSARLNQEIRIKRGLSYGAGSTIDARRDSGAFVAAVQTKNESAAEVVSLILAELKRLDTEAVPADELVARKAVVIGNFGRSLQTTDGLVSRMAGLALYGLSLDEINHYISNVSAVTPEQVQAFARGHLEPDTVHIIVVGDASKFADALKKQLPGVRVIPASRLDLNNPATLEKPHPASPKPVPPKKPGHG
jgi:zinc protease